NTDICLSRSEDAGDTWRLVAPRTRQTLQSPLGVLWNNVYELAFGGGAIYAAVSTEHDLPYNTQFRDNSPPPAGAPGQGAVLASTDGGVSWSEHGANLPPNRPVTSAAYGGSPATLYAAVLGSGVYRFDAGNG